MPVDMPQIMDEAEKLGKLVAQHPIIERYKNAQKSVAEDTEASRLLVEFDRQLDALSKQEQSGMTVTDAQRQQLESMQSRIISHIKIKNLNLAQVEFVDLLRKVTQTIQKQLLDTPTPTAGAPAGPRAVR